MNRVIVSLNNTVTSTAVTYSATVGTHSGTNEQQPVTYKVDLKCNSEQWRSQEFCSVGGVQQI